jgi:hypothetical protein
MSDCAIRLGLPDWSDKGIELSVIGRVVATDSRNLSLLSVWLRAEGDTKRVDAGFRPRLGGTSAAFWAS